MISGMVKDIVAAYSPKTMEINGKDYKVINDPSKGQVVYYKSFRDREGQYKVGEFYKVEITNGYYWTEGGLCNFWYWYRLDEEGNRVREECGYGCFLECE